MTIHLHSIDHCSISTAPPTHSDGWRLERAARMGNNSHTIPSSWHGREGLLPSLGLTNKLIDTTSCRLCFIPTTQSGQPARELGQTKPPHRAFRQGAPCYTPPAVLEYCVLRRPSSHIHTLPHHHSLCTVKLHWSVSTPPPLQSGVRTQP